MSPYETGSPSTHHQHPWMKATLGLAALYNLAWGLWVVLDPGALFRLTGLPAPLYPQIWQCVGMMVGVYGVGYAVAAAAPLRHWPIVLVGLLGKILGPAGFAVALADRALPASWGWIILANDLVWWAPFGLILAAAWRSRPGAAAAGNGEPLAGPSVALALRVARSHRGESLLSLSRRRPRLVVCLRHLGCSFCRETLAEVSRRRAGIEGAGVSVVLVHPGSDDERAARLFETYGLAAVDRIADPGRVLYGALGLARGGWRQVLGPRVFWRAARAATHGHRPGRKGGDVWQMPGAFLIADGRVVEAFRPKDVAEMPDLEALAAATGSTDDRRRAETRP